MKNARYNVNEDQDQPRCTKAPIMMYLPTQQEASPVVVWIYEDIGEPDLYVDLIQSLAIAGPNEVFHLRINTSGGNLWSCLAIVNAIRSTEATVIGYADGLVASAGTFILFACHEFYLNEYCMIMCHDAHGGAAGQKLSDNKRSNDAIARIYSKLAHELYSGLFTDDEIRRILGGEDFWEDVDQMEARIEQHQKLLLQEEPTDDEQEEIVTGSEVLHG